MARQTKQDQIDALKRSLRSTARKLGAAMRERDAMARERDYVIAERDDALAKADLAPDFDAVMNAARRWHYGEVRSIADEAIKTLLAESPRPSDPREWLTTWVDETTDGHSHVIYNGRAAMLLAASDNSGAYEDDTGEKPADDSTAACVALRADVWQLLDARSEEWETAEDDDDDDDKPSCAAYMGCLCAAHASGATADEPCDATERPR